MTLYDETDYEEFNRCWPRYRCLKGDGSIQANCPSFAQNVLPYDIEEEGWDTYKPERELERMFMLLEEKNKKWKITNANFNYEICPSYPRVNAIPVGFDDSMLRAASEHRDLGRFPGLSWIHPQNFTVIARCSQPLSGRLGNIRCTEDEMLVEEIFKTNPNKPIHENKIIDARPFSNAVANRYKGAGFETKEFYLGCEIEFMDIENIHTMRQSLEKVRRMCRGLSVNDSYSVWTSRLDSTGWLGHVQMCLKAGIRISKLLSKGVSVILHCSHGWDRTAQLSSIAQLIMDPHFRTLRGFEELIEKEWISFGHRVADRAGHLLSLGTSTNPGMVVGELEEEEESPIFPQFIDCVFQLLIQFPLQFGFNQEFLIAIIDGFYNCKYGTFLANSEKERHELRLRQHTVSLWSDLNHAKNIGKYLNPLYHHSNIVNVLNPSVSPNKIVFWSNLYDRCESTLTPPPSMVIASRVTQLLDERRVDQEVQKIQESHAKLLSKLQKQQILAEILSERLGVNLDDDDLIREVKERLHVRKSQTKQVRIPTTTVTTAAATTTTTTTTTTTNTATPHPPAPPANPPAAPTPAAAATTGTSANTTQNYKEFYNFQGQKKKNVVVQ
eukprot:TRINITY_DN4864_c0_g2_i2.p1 TRINITY_DN4864_c0_g2~~TRINITY_DN4864_c0_g2_i2.p1  ORF type:complete len:611 (-),score=146.20 TRINITY_DN4864_c0_g2_i2:36-1868(-)